MTAGRTWVRVPASSANLGPGFDALGMALDLHAELGVDDGDGMRPEGARAIDPGHPASVAFRAAGGQGTLWERCPIPSGRGLGFSGAVRVAGAVLAVATADDPDRWLERRDEVQALVARLEGHPDNVAASLYGGVVVAAAGRVVRLPVALDPTIVVWVPSSSTSTDESRRTLAAKVTRDDAVFNVGRTALLVAALATGDVESLRDACADRLHQDHRLAAVPRSRAALDAALENGAWAAWLSGSGPTVAAMCAPDDAARLAAVMDTATRTGAATDEPALGRTMVLRIDQRGATLERS